MEYPHAAVVRERKKAPVILAVASSLLTLLLLELGFRVWAYVVDRRTLGRLSNIGSRSPAPGSSVRLGQILRASSNGRIIYELIPGLDVTFLGAPLKTNAAGFRAPEVSEKRPGRTVRVLGLGDSVMFGWGVADEDAYLARLAKRLRQAYQEVDWEVINTAVPGYNTVMEVETLREKGLAYDPDVVIINFVGNDLGLPNFIVEERDVLSPARSFLFEFMRSRLRGESETALRLENVPPDVRRFRGGADLDRVPHRYRDMVGPSAYRQAMAELARLGQQHGIAVVVLAHPQATAPARDTAALLGLLLIETHDAVATGPPDTPLTLGPEDPHPSPFGHAVIADVLFVRLREAGVLARVSNRRGMESEMHGSPDSAPGR